MGKLFWRFFLLLCLVGGCVAGYGIDNMIGEQRMGQLAQDELELRQKEQEIIPEQQEPEEVQEFVPRAENVPGAVSMVQAESMPEVEDIVPVENVPEVESVLQAEVAEQEKEEIVNYDIVVSEQVETLTDIKEEMSDLKDAVENLNVAVEEMKQELPEVPRELETADHALLRLSSVIAETKNKDNADVTSTDRNTEMLPVDDSVEMTTETITYPAEIFGQVPVVNRSDEYMTYFEFVLDMMEMVQPEIKARKLNEAALVTKFTVRALVYGVDISRIQINAPIPRSQAALALWIAAQVMEEPGTDTVAAKGALYANDLTSSGNSVKRAVAYLYQKGIAADKKSSNGSFYPEESLREADGNVWIRQAKQCWN